MLPSASGSIAAPQVSPPPAPPAVPAAVALPAPAATPTAVAAPAPPARQVEPVIAPAPPARRPIFAPTLVQADTDLLEAITDPPPAAPEPEVDPHVLDAQRIRDRMIQASRERRAESAELVPTVDPELPDWYEPEAVEAPVRKRRLGRSGR